MQCRRQQLCPVQEEKPFHPLANKGSSGDVKEGLDYGSSSEGWWQPQDFPCSVLPLCSQAQSSVLQGAVADEAVADEAVWLWPRAGCDGGHWGLCW